MRYVHNYRLNSSQYVYNSTLNIAPCFCTCTVLFKIELLRFPWHLGSGAKKRSKYSQPYITYKNFGFGFGWQLKNSGSVILEIMPEIWQPNSDGFIDPHSTAICRGMCGTCVGRHWTITHSLYLEIVLYHSVSFVGDIQSDVDMSWTEKWFPLQTPYLSFPEHFNTIPPIRINLMSVLI